MNSDPIFIVGTMRSGSTLLRLLLDAHPDLAIGTETGFMQAVRQIESVPGFLYGDRWYEGYGLTRDDLRERIAAFYDGIFGEHARAEGKRRWGEKTPFHVWHMEEMAALFPRAQFVAIVRHAGAMAASLHRWRYEFGDHVDEWLSVNHEILRRAAGLGDRLALLRFEELLARPEAVMRELVDFLGLAWSPDLLRHHEVHAARGNTEPVEGGTRPTDAIDPARAWTWLEGSTRDGPLDPELLHEIECLAGPTLRFFGYEPAGLALGPLPGGRAVATGSDLAAGLRDNPFELRAAREGRHAHDIEVALADARRELITIKRQRSVRYARALSSLLRARSRRDLRRAWQALRGRPSLDPPARAV